MPRLGVVGRSAGSALWLVMVASLAACGDDTSSGTALPGSGVAGTSSPSATSATGSGGAAGSGGAGGSAGDGGASSSTGIGGDQGSSEGVGAGIPTCETAPLGPTPIEEVDVESCLPIGGSPVPVGDPDLGADYLDQLISIGTRRAAGGRYTSNGPILMDADGSNASAPVLVDGTILAVRAADLGVLRQGPTLERFDEDGGALGDAVTVSDQTGPQWLAADDSGWLLAWLVDEEVHAVALEADGTPRADEQVLDNAWFEETFGFKSASRGSTTALVFGGSTITDGRIGVSLWTDGANEVTNRESICAPAHLSLLAAVSREEGWLLLLELGDPGSLQTLLVPLDADGTSTEPARHLVGFQNGFSMARNGATVMVTGESDEGLSIARAFDAATLAPLAPPVCLTNAATGFPVAVDADVGGFAFLHANDEGSQLLLTLANENGEGL